MGKYIFGKNCRIPKKTESETPLFRPVLHVMTNKPGTAQVGAISKAQKDENHFFYNWRQQKLSKNLKLRKKIPIFFRNFFEVSGKSHSAEKCKRGGTPWDFLNIHSVAKYQKLMGGTIKKIRKKSVSQCQKKEENLIV